ncbi:MAG: hypothetical protein ACMG6E_09070, partial [Candidatus Roizmanbacteria bacterium]
MGKGLNLCRSGTYIAFATGTCCLVFVDLIAHLIRKNLDLLSEYEKATGLKDDFRFVLFASFASREDSIGLEMMEGLRDICKV